MVILSCKSNSGNQNYGPIIIFFLNENLRTGLSLAKNGRDLCTAYPKIVKKKAVTQSDSHVPSELRKPACSVNTGQSLDILKS